MKRVTVDKVMAEQRAASFTKRSIKGPSKEVALRLAMSMIDLTTLEGKDTHEKVRSLCRKGVDPADGSWTSAEPLPSVAAICVYPMMVDAARKELNKLGDRGRGVKVAAVATGFPSGQYPLKVRLDDTRRAVDAGADEIDMVISRGALLAGNQTQIYDEICATIEACGFKRAPESTTTSRAAKSRASSRGESGSPIATTRTKRAAPPTPPTPPTPHAFAHLKVILETGELETLDLVREASDISIRAMHDTGLSQHPGAGFIKTSTGKVEPAATMPVTLVMLQAISDHYHATGELVGMKPAGGIRTAKTAVQYLVMLKETLGDIEHGAYLHPSLFRFGASALLNDLCRQLTWLRRGRYASRYDFAEA
ncbi:MAG: hypothetical protein K2X32_01285 [Phycisphaerales bacterium]|nr:hypothetical protein [Phycisphaerales bacterium]